MRYVDIKPGKKPGHLTGINIYHLLFRLRPDKAIQLKSLVPYAESVLIPKKYFDNISPPVAKGEKMTRKNIAVKIIGHELAKAVNRFAHICVTNSYIDLCLPGYHHDRPSNTATTLFRAEEEKSFSNLIRILLPKTMVRPESSLPAPVRIWE